jgi:hypothetical protein
MGETPRKPLSHLPPQSVLISTLQVNALSNFIGKESNVKLSSVEVRSKIYTHMVSKATV